MVSRAPSILTRSTESGIEDSWKRRDQRTGCDAIAALPSSWVAEMELSARCVHPRLGCGGNDVTDGALECSQAVRTGGWAR